MLYPKKARVHWIDIVKGFGILLVVYGHNLPYLENYIYSFHMPLFFFISGLFHPDTLNLEVVKKRVKQVLIPYFLWSFLLYFFWFFIGRKFGDSSSLGLSALKNFIGIFYAQGGHEYMNWGLPMWFLPAIFLNFIILGCIRKLKTSKHQILVILALVCLGFLIANLFKMHLFWSIDVSLVSLFFYAFAFYLKDVFFSDKHKYDRAIIFVLFVSHVVCSFYLPNKIDMYRSVYGNVLLFLFNASIGIGFWVLLFKKLKRFNFLAFLGKNTLPILAVHTRALTVIKLFLLLFWSSKSFAFNEYEKIILVVLQLLIIYPVILFINKKTPVLNGKIKVVEARV